MLHRSALVLACALFFISPHETLQASPPATIGATVQTWHYDIATKTLTLRILNTSHKDITAYNISLTVKYVDGTTNFAENSRDFLPLMGSMAEMEAAGGDEEMRQRYGNGAFAAGTLRDDVFPAQPKDVADVTAVIDVVAYSDATADVDNDRAFNHLALSRRARDETTRKVNEVIQRALADPNVTDPTANAVAELKRLADVSHTQLQHLAPGQVVLQEMDLRSAIRDLEGSDASASHTPKRDYLAKYVAHNQHHLAVTAAQANLSKRGPQ
jgi:hypothetical protein